MKEEELRSRLMALTSIAAGYCSALENCRDCEREDFIRDILGFLPRIYWEFSDLSVEENPDVSELIISLNMSMRITMKVCDVQWKL